MKSWKRLLRASLAMAMLFVVAATSAFGQGRVSAYTTQTFTTAWNEISSSGTPITFANGDIWGTGYAQFSLPFDFVYDNKTVAAGTQIGLGANGYVSLSGSQVYGPALGTSSYPGLLCFFSGYIVTGDGDHGDNYNYYQVTGTAPNRVLTIEARRMHFNGAGGGTGTGGGSTQTAMQVKLYETSNIIEYIYKDLNHSFGTYYYSGTGPDIGLNGFNNPTFTSKVYAKGLTSTPTTDIRFIPPAPPSQLSLQPKSLNFGAQSTGTSTVLCVTARSVGVSNLKILGYTISGAGDYSLVSGPLAGDSILAGGSAQYCIQFVPIANGTRTATFTLLTNGNDSGNQSVSLTGSGVAPSIDLTTTSLFRKVKVRVGDSASMTFPVASVGAGPLEFISSVFSGLNPDQYSVTRTPMNPLPIGATDSFRVTFKPTFEGRPDATLTITTNAINQPISTIQMFGTGVLPRLTMSPEGGTTQASAGATLRFDSVPIGTTVCKTVTLRNPGTDTIHILRTVKTGGDYDFSFTGLSGSDTAIAPDQSRTVSFCFTPLRNGTRDATVRFFTDVPLTYQNPRTDTSQFVLTVIGTGVPTGQLAFSGVAIDTAIVGIQKCVSDTIWNYGTSDFTVTSASVLGDSTSPFSLSGATVPFTLRPGQSKVVQLCFTPSTRGFASDSLMLAGTTAGQPKTLTLPLMGVGLAQCGQTAPLALFTAMTPVGMMDTGTVTVTNCGDVPAVYTAALGSGSTGYTILAPTTSATVAPGATTTFNVIYAPTAIGSNTGTMDITSPGISPMSVSLGGVGSGVAITSSGTTGPDVMVGDCQNFDVTLMNTGNVTWTPGTGAISNPAFTIVAAPATISAGNSGTVTVKFCPTAVGPATGTLSFASAAPTALSGVPITLNANGIANGVAMQSEALGFVLSQTYPNPTRGVSDVRFTLPYDAPVRLGVIDQKGNLVKLIMESHLEAGEHTVRIDATGLASGSYFYQLESGDVRLARQLVVVR